MAKYMQKCDECGAKYYMDDPAQRKSVCDECGKRSIRLSVPVLLQDAESPQGGGKRPPEGPKGTGSGPADSQVSSEGGEINWAVIMKSRREKQMQEGKDKEGKAEEKDTVCLRLRVSGRQGSAELRLDDSKGPVFIGQYWIQGKFFEKDPRVSRTHCVFFRMSDGNWYVRDMHSSNGTFLCERPGTPVIKVTADEPAGVVKGSIIMLGPWDDAVRLEVTEA